MKIDAFRMYRLELTLFALREY